MIKDILGYEGLYAITDKGEVLSLVTTNSRRKGLMKQSPNTADYLRVPLYKNGRQQKFFVHRLVAEAFVPNPSNLPNVNHINARQTDNRAVNLEWVSQKANIQHSRNLGNQNKDYAVVAINETTGEVKEFVCLRYAASALFGKPHRLQYHHKRNGPVFSYGGWQFNVQGGDAT